MKCRVERVWPHGKASRLLVALCGIFLSTCRQQMADQPRHEPLGKSAFFGDGRSSRPQVEGTVARGQLRTDELFYSGKVASQAVDMFPFPVTLTILGRGQERFNIFCSPCHDRVGNGQGIIVQRGFRPPPSFHIDRLRKAPAGHLFDVISRGFGAMPDYASQLSPEDRWAVVAYIRALQLSQQVALTALAQQERRKLLETKG